MYIALGNFKAKGWLIFQCLIIFQHRMNLLPGWKSIMKQTPFQPRSLFNYHHGKSTRLEIMKFNLHAALQWPGILKNKIAEHINVPWSLFTEAISHILGSLRVACFYFRRAQRDCMKQYPGRESAFYTCSAHFTTILLSLVLFGSLSTYTLHAERERTPPHLDPLTTKQARGKYLRTSVRDAEINCVLIWPAYYTRSLASRPCDVL